MQFDEIQFEEVVAPARVGNSDYDHAWSEHIRLVLRCKRADEHIVVVTDGGERWCGNSRTLMSDVKTGALHSGFRREHTYEAWNTPRLMLLNEWDKRFSKRGPIGPAEAALCRKFLPNKYAAALKFDPAAAVEQALRPRRNVCAYATPKKLLTVKVTGLSTNDMVLHSEEHSYSRRINLARFRAAEDEALRQARRTLREIPFCGFANAPVTLEAKKNSVGLAEVDATLTCYHCLGLV